MAPNPKRICLVTIHGIGFQQAPCTQDGIPGYADMLHERLAKYLDALLLGDDPNRRAERRARGEAGPVYVQSTWPPQSNATEPGLSRLGKWAQAPRTIEIDGQALTDAGQPIAHVALVYSHLEDQQPRLGSLAEATADVIGALSHGQYTSLLGAARLLIADFSARPEHPVLPGDNATPSLRVRSDALGGAPGGTSGKSRQAGGRAARPGAAQALQPSNNLMTTLVQLERDVAAYVCRNELRERVRGFVRDALLRLIFRSDLDGIVVNAHSQGTVLAFDVLRDLPPFAATKVLGFVSAGSPLRKYRDAFNWGDEIGGIRGMPWTNYWDPRDPVADPLAPPAQWRPGSPTNAASAKWQGKTLFQWVDPDDGNAHPVPVDDRRVNNLAFSVGGGLQAHNYWDNEREMVQPLAELLRALAARPAPVSVGVPAHDGSLPTAGD